MCVCVSIYIYFFFPLELQRHAQFNAVFSAFSTSNVRQPAKSGIMGDLTPLQPVTVNMFFFFGYVFMACTNLLLLCSTACIGTSTDVYF
jgi:hypothetical protein